MQLRHVLLVCGGVLLAAGCATLNADYDYDASVDFSKLHTYGWLPRDPGSSTQELTVKRIQNAVNSKLQAKGLTLTSDNPDFLIAMQLSGKTTYGGSTGVGASVGIPVGRAGTISVGGGKSKPHEKTEGTLVLDFVDAKTQSLVWRGTATAAVQPKTSPEEQQERINKVIAEMLSRFPPKK